MHSTYHQNINHAIYSIAAQLQFTTSFWQSFLTRAISVRAQKDREGDWGRRVTLGIHASLSDPALMSYMTSHGKSPATIPPAIFLGSKWYCSCESCKCFFHPGGDT